MNHQHYLVYENYLILKQEFNAFIERLKSDPDVLFEVNYRNAEIQIAGCCYHFVTAKRENFMGKTIHSVYFDDSGTFEGNVVNEAVNRVSRTTWRRGI